MFGGLKQIQNRKQSDQQASAPRSSSTHPVVQIGAASADIAARRRGPNSGNPNERPRSYMQPTNLNLKVIARDATLRGDTKALFHALDLLERVVPIATRTELEELRLQGARQHQ